MRRLVTAFLLTATACSSAADDGPRKAPESQRNFVACPIVLDTMDVPCWVAEYEGERYYLTVQTGRGRGVTYAPQLKHRVLVEGTVSDEPRICGGIVLRDVVLSAFAEVEPDCGVMLPGGGYRTVGPRPVGPDGDRGYLGPDGDRVYSPQGVPDRSHERRVVPVELQPEDSFAYRQKTYQRNARTREPMEFHVPYFFDALYLNFPVPQDAVQEAADYAVAVDASRVKVVAHRGATVLSAGGRIVEAEGVPEARARHIAYVLEEFGVPQEALEVSWSDVGRDQGGVRDYELRGVTIAVLP